MTLEGTAFQADLPGHIKGGAEIADISAMGAEAGWYADPADGSRLRYWDGQNWSPQTHIAAVATKVATPAPNPYANPESVLPYVGVPPGSNGFPGRKRGLSGGVIVAAIAALVVILGVIGWAADNSGKAKAIHPQATAPPAFRSSYPPGCVTPLPVGASPAAAAYVQALNAASPAWSYVDQSYRLAQVWTVSALQAEADADGTFVTALDHISFPSYADATAKTLITSINDYRALILQNIADITDAPADNAKEMALVQTRSTASSDLRRLLGLPQGTCFYNRPA